MKEASGLRQKPTTSKARRIEASEARTGEQLLAEPSKRWLEQTLLNGIDLAGWLVLRAIAPPVAIVRFVSWSELHLGACLGECKRGKG